MTSRDNITNTAIQILEGEITGLKYSELCCRIKNALPNVNENTINRTVVELDKIAPSKVYKPAKGIFQHLKVKNDAVETLPSTVISAIREENFYAPFAKWIKDELQECTKAIPLVQKPLRLLV